MPRSGCFRPEAGDPLERLDAVIDWEIFRPILLRIDATFVPVPIQRNGREDNALVKQDAVPIDWGKIPAKLAGNVDA